MAAVLTFLFIATTSPLYSQVAAAKPSITSAQATQLIHSQPYFERNDGQFDARVLYEAHGLEYSAFLTREGATLVLPAASPAGKDLARRSGHVVRLGFTGMNTQAEVAGLDRLSSYSSYFSGSDPKKWQTRVPQFSRVHYREIYPGIDLIFYICEGRLEYDFEVAPGADTRAIRMSVEGAHAKLTSDGDVVLLETDRELIRLRKPQAEQPGIKARPVGAGYSVHGQHVSLVMGQYDRSRPLLIDPALVFSTFVTSDLAACGTGVQTIAVDSSGIYVLGFTCATTFPFVAGGPAPTQGTISGFVVKLDPLASRVIYSTFLTHAGGSAFAVDGSGAVYVVGGAQQGDTSFPTTPGAYVSSASIPCVSGHIALCTTVPFALKLDPTGTKLVYSTLLLKGGPLQINVLQSLVATQVAVDAAGSVYVAGDLAQNAVDVSVSAVMPVEVSAGAFQATPGNLFALKLNPAGTALQYATYLDGNNTGVAITGLALDGAGAAYITGTADGGYPTTPGALLTGDPAPSLGESGFVTKLSADGTSQVYSTYVDPLGTGNSRPKAIAVDTAGEAVIVGPASPSAFVSKLNAAGSAAVYSNNLANTTAGASFTTLSLDSSGAAYVAGFTSDVTSFVLKNPIQSYVPGNPPPGSSPLIAAKLDASGALVWSTLLGNSIDSGGSFDPAIALDATNNAYIKFTTKENDGLGGTSGTIDPLAPPFRSDMLVKIAPSLGAPVAVLAPNPLSFADTLVGMSNSADIIVGNYGDAALAAPTVSVTGPFSETNTCSASVPAAQKCAVNVVFSPTTIGAQTGTLTVSFGGTPALQTVALSGNAISPLVGLANPIAFSPQAVGVSGTKSVTLTNTGTAPLSISAIQATGDFSQSNNCTSTITPQGTCLIQVTFVPTASGFRNGALNVTDNAPGSPQSFNLIGFGGTATTATLSSGSLSFGSQAVGITSTAQTVTLSNTGSLALAINSISASGDFAQSNNCGSSVNAGGNCQASVTFTPTALGSRTGVLTITDNTTGLLQTVLLSGTGVGPSLGLNITGGSTSTVTAGGTANYSLAIGGQGMSGTATLTCTGAPAAATCTVPNSMTFSSTTAATFTASVATTARTTAALRPSGSGMPWAWAMTLLGIVVVPFAGRAKRSQRKRSYLIAFSLLVLTMLCSCGGGSHGGGQNGTPPGTFTLTVTATSGSTSQSTTLTLTVQ